MIFGRRRPDPAPITVGDVIVQEDGFIVTALHTVAAMFSGDYPTPSTEPARPVVVLDITGYDQQELLRREPRPTTTRYIFEAGSVPTVIEHLTTALTVLDNMQRNQESP